MEPEETKSSQQNPEQQKQSKKHFNPRVPFILQNYDAKNTA